MARLKLTTGKIRELEYPEKGQVFLWDSEVPGLGVRSTSNSKTFVFQSRLGPKTIRVKIGDTKTWAIDSKDPKLPGARQEARRLKSLIDSGVDPRNEKKKRIVEEHIRREEEKRSEITFSDAWTDYLEARKDRWSEHHYKDHLKSVKQGGQLQKRGHKKSKPGPLVDFLPLKLSDLTQERIASWLENESQKRPTRARLAFAHLKAFLRWCDAQQGYAGLVSPDICSTWVKREYVPKMRSKNDCLQKEQLKAWFSAVRDYHNPVMSAYLQAVLLTGSRRNEIATLKWDDVDFKWESLTIQNDKVDGVRVIPLTPYVKWLISRLPRRNEWVFSSPGAKSGRVMEPCRPHNNALEVAGIEGLTIHGLRRSFGTLSEWVECPAGVVAQIMGHKPSATAEKHYKKRPLDLLRMWHVKIEDWILRQAGIKQK